MTEQAEIKIRGLMSKVSKEELEETLLSIISVSPNSEHTLAEKFKHMSSDARALLMSIMLKMVLSTVEAKGREKKGVIQDEGGRDISV